MVRRKSRKLTARILQIIVTTMLATGAVSLSAVGWMTYTVERGRQQDIKRHIQEAISSKAVTLASGHALALKGLVADNAFEETRRLITAAMENDSDLVYALFVGPEHRPWVYISPTHPGARSEQEVSEGAVSEIGFNLKGRFLPGVTQRSVRAFGEELQESRAVVVSDDDEPLGVIAYGFSNKRLLQAVRAAEVRSNNALTRAFLGSGLVGLISLGIGIAWVSRAAVRTTRPVAELTEAANEIAAGNRGLRVRVQGNEEVEQLGAAFNQMLEANEATMRELEETTERALAADRLKSEFLANMSHEIRTPMNGVLGMIHLIQTMPIEGKLRRYVDTIDVSAHSLLTIVNDILDFSKMEAGKYTIQSVPFEPQVVLQEVGELLATRAHDKGIELISRIAPDLPERVLGDPDRFRQILNNLVGNAIKFTDRGEVFIDSKLKSKSSDSAVVEVSVLDTGIGIDESDLPRLYGAFTQVDGSLVRRQGGTGLGLAISKRLVTMMGGEIHVESRVGEGSQFSFTVRFGLPVEHSSRPRVPRAAPGRRVLVIDANRRSRLLTEEYLKRWQMAGQGVESVGEGIECFVRALSNKAPFDAAILVSERGDQAASQLVQAIRSRPEGQAIPLILVRPISAAMSSPIEREFSAQLNKPVRFSELYNCLTQTFPTPNPPSARSPAVQPTVQSRKRVLVVDDNDINRFVAAEELTGRGFDVEEAVNGQEALEKLVSDEYLCVLMDCQMPTMDGYEATRRLRALEDSQGRRRTPVIALTAHAFVGERERVLAAGMDYFLAKPFRPSSLEKLLQACVQELGDSGPPDEHVVALDPKGKRSAKLVQLFLDRVPEQLSELDRAIEKGDPVQTRAVAHKLKGSCLAIAAGPMSESAQAIQHHAERQELSEARAHFSMLEQQSKEVMALLTRELSEGPRETSGAASTH